MQTKVFSPLSTFFVSIDIHGGHNTAEIEAKWSLGVRMYNRYAELSHLPNIVMVESGTPRAPAVVAAPIRNECPT